MTGTESLIAAIIVCVLGTGLVIAAIDGADLEDRVKRLERRVQQTQIGQPTREEIRDMIRTEIARCIARETRRER